MSKGKATARLNDILSQGSSVKTSGVKSVLDQEKEATPSHDEDPEIQDITEITTLLQEHHQLVKMLLRI